MEKKQTNKSRREFAKRLALISSTPILTTFCISSTPSETQNSAPQSAEQLIDASAKGLLEITKVRYGKNIGKDDLPKIQSAIARNYVMAEKLRQTKLKNSDEPAIIFRA